MFSKIVGALSASGGENVVIAPAQEVRRWVEAAQVVLIDVREPDEYAAGAIAGSINLPLSRFEPSQLPPVPEDKKLVLHCQAGVRCGKVAAILVRAGYDGAIHRMEGGIMGWRAAGGPVVR